jgi:uncharacterized membrane protein
MLGAGERRKSVAIPAILLAGLVVLFVLSLIDASSRLPERFATHFDSAGQPNGWMTRSAHLLFSAALGLGLPILVTGLCYSFRFFPVKLLNLPHRDYWLAPARRAQTYAYLFRHSLWLGCLMIGFVIGINLLLIQANAQAPPRLSAPLIFTLASGFIVGILAWAIGLQAHFARIPKPDKG